MSCKILKVFAVFHTLGELDGPLPNFYRGARSSREVDAKFLVTVRLRAALSVVEVVHEQSDGNFAPGTRQILDAGQKLKKRDAVFSTGNQYMNSTDALCEVWNQP